MRERKNLILGQCLAWFFFRLSEKNEFQIFIDKEEEDLIIHTFLTGKEPPIHRQKRIPGIVKDYSQIADLFQPKKKKKDKKLEDFFDSEFIKALTHALNLNILTASRDGLKIRLGDFEITDLDGFIPEKNIWIEVTATKEVDKHFFDKMGRLGVCREEEVVLETKEFNPVTAEYEVKQDTVVLKELKLFHVGLFPIQFEFKSSVSFRSWSLLKSKDPNEIRSFVVSKNFEDLMWERIQEIRNDLKKFTS